MQAYSQDLRDRVLGALERGESPTAIAERFEVSRVWVYQVKKRLEQSGLRMSLPIGGHRVSRVAALEEQVRGWIAQEPDLTLAELCQRLQSENGIHLKAPALWHQLNKWGLSYKKNTARQRARTRGCAPGTRALAAKPARLASRKARLSG
jgi:transposase